ncbi:MAG: hypothetical protein PF795_00765 [Kiritimatiellae bacterium]|jgi:uncharacterized membrane protein YhiD involved in acid resistance|nr:hypothetical protein [Kiritimatiellia bacterium]
MTPIFPIYKLTLRSILRERVALSMLALLVLVLLLLPQGLQTDGTVEGALRMHIRYSLGFSSVLLAGMTLWVSCASIAGDLTSKRLQMVLTKPVGRMSLWWGKWLAVVTLVTILALLCGGVTLWRIHRMVHQTELTDSEKERVYSQQVTARKPVDAEVEDLTPRAREMMQAQRQAGALPGNVPEEEILANILRFLQFSRHAASSDESVSWTFPFSRPLVGGEPLQIAYQFDGSSMGLSKVPGRWVLETAEQPELFEQRIEQTPHGEHVISLEVSPEMAGLEELTLTFTNLSEDGDRVFFKSDRGVRLYLEGGAFAPNLLRAILLIIGLLAILAAIGVSAGSVFSLPVACYATSVILLLQAFSGVVEEVLEQGPSQEETETTLISKAVQEIQLGVFKGVLVILKPLQVESPLGRVSRGVQIAATEVAGIFFFRFIPIILVISSAGIFCLSKREVVEAV